MCPMCPTCSTCSPPTAGTYAQVYDLARAIFNYESPLPAPLDTLPLSLKMKFKRTELFDFRVDAQKTLWSSFVDAEYVQLKHKRMLQPGNPCDPATHENRRRAHIFPDLSRLCNHAGNMYPDLDKTVLFCMLRHFKPKRMVRRIPKRRASHPVDVSNKGPELTTGGDWVW